MVKFYLIASLLCLYVNGSQAAPARVYFLNEDTLKIGDKAPPLSIIKWVRGIPIRKFEKNKIYIVEFGFAACTPCRSSIPHLSAIAKKYKGRIQIISVHIWENNIEKPRDLTYISKVEKFVQAMGDKISYAVAIDVPLQTTALSWGGGAPRAFVVGRKGTIEWVGHPDDLEPVIEQLLVNSFDPQSTADKETATKKYIHFQMEKAWNNKDSGHTAIAIAIVDSLLVQFPAQHWLYYEKYRLLDGADSANQSANALVKWLLATKPKGFDMMYYLSHAIIQSKHPDYDLAIAMAEWALRESDYNFISANILDAEATAYFKMGNRGKALEVQRRAIALLKPENTEMTETIEGLQKRLHYFITH